MSQSIKRNRTTNYQAIAENGELSEITAVKKDALDWRKQFKKTTPNVPVKIATTVNLQIIKESEWK